MYNRRVSIADLAQQLNVATSTVSRALSDHSDVSEATKGRVRQLAEKLNYRPNHLASGLRKGRSGTLGVLVPHLTGHFFPEVLHTITTEATKAGWHVMICESNEDEHQERKNLDLLLNAQVEGVLVSLASSTRDFGHFEAVRQQVPLVFFDRVPEDPSFSAVVLDDYRGAYQMTAHLIEQGRTRIAYFTGPLHVSVFHHRLRGYREALLAHGLPFEAQLVHESDLSVQAGRQGMAQLLTLSQRPDAVLTAKDVAAVGARQVLEAQGLGVPDEVALASFSNARFTELAAPGLTSVDQQCAALGRAALRLLLEQVRAAGRPVAPCHLLLAPRLLLRESSQRPLHLRKVG
ncbi:LacI family DNA-binding transcriptional regulator [Hymenobacter jejuensis]|uniref:LacI family transcriptional regulator n=1 Tax=Hymenobacter jejuensis TaxID=2502781 RepID=A0A5B8A2W7_9BACT|nr:LacI family DNA-binding transcriptional regulator [Hymenobacter jejuensis]QDA61658.1 LacI family transcriptional regulator [Hymenobacter jejuensis]